MSDVVIKVDDLSKVYRIGTRPGEHDTFREAISDFLFTRFKRLTGKSLLKDTEDTIWALRDVSFEVKRGDVLGIIGRNGAGKSTLLKILSRITAPTRGRVEIEGRVASLLEVGTGFHPELTGRENIFLNGAILGMTRHEIRKKFDEIVEFSEIEKFIDTPVKRYSSGMYVRLAFSVAAHLEPEILMVDEVLSVGDASFQKKCMGKMGDVTKEGRTVLFVSHNMVAVQNLCGRVIWLNEGNILEQGESGNIVSSYLQTSFESLKEQVWNDIETAPGNEKVRLRRACVRPEGGGPKYPINTRTPLVMEFEYWNMEPDAYLNLSVHVFNEQGIKVFAVNTVQEPNWHGRPFPVGLFRSMCRVPGDLMNIGTYKVMLLIVRDRKNTIHREEEILVFDVIEADDDRDGWYGKWPGVVRPVLQWRTELVEKNE